MMPVCLRQVIELVLRSAHRARRDRMQQGFPDVRAGEIDQRDPRLAAAPEAIAQARGQLQAARTASGDDDVVP
jgi:hypothetical protein